jgi:type I restriction enzyme M protein
MKINYLKNENIYFEQSYKTQSGITILKTWDDIHSYNESSPATNYFVPELNENISILENDIKETFSFEEVLEQPFVSFVEPIYINSIKLDSDISIDNIYFNEDNYFLLENEILIPLSKSLKRNKKDIPYVIHTNDNIAIKLKSKEIMLSKITSKDYIKQSKTYFINDVNISQFQDEENVSFSIDYLNNIYLNKDEEIKIFNNKKLSKISKNHFSSTKLMEESENNYSILETVDIEGVKVIEKITLTDIKTLLWSIADEIRDKGNSNDTMDYIKIGLPFLFLKRLLDLRKEYILHNLNDSIKDDNFLIASYSNKLVGKIEKLRDKTKLFETEKTNWYCITWQDIVNFKENSSGNTISLNLSLFPELTIETEAKTRQEFLLSVVESITANRDEVHKLVNQIFTIMEFKNKIKDSGKLTSEVFDNICFKFAELEFSYENAPQDIFSQSYMYFLERFVSTAGKKGGEFFTPVELIQKVLPLLDLNIENKNTIKIADLTSGSASFLVESFDYLKNNYKKENPDKSDKEIMNYLNKKVEIIAQEKDEVTECMGLLNLALKEISNVKSFCANSILKYKETIGQYAGQVDYVVANPPYGLNDYGADFATKEFSSNGNESRWRYGIPNKGDGDIAFVLTILDLLKKEGKAGIVLPLGTLFKDSTKNIREKLLEQDFIEGIVMLPSNMFQTTSIPVCFWILNKNKEEKDKNKVFMINASEEYLKVGKFNEWQEEKSLYNYANRILEEGLSGYVSISDIKDNDFNLSVQRYVFKDEPEEVIDIVELNSDIIKLSEDIMSKQNDMNLVLSKIMNLVV